MEKIECEWYPTEEKRHPDDTEKNTHGHTFCLVDRKNYGLQVLAWNHYHEVWDDEQADDFVCQASEVTSFMILPDKFPT